MSTQRENKTTQTYWIHIRLNRRRAATDLFFVGVGKFHTIRSFANAQMHAMAAHTRPQSSLSLHIHPKSRPLGMRIMHSDRLSFAVVRAASYQHVCSRNSRINSLSRLRSHSRISYKLKEEKEKKRTCRRPGERFSCNAMCARWCVCVCVRAIVYTLHWVVSVFRFSSNLFIFLLFHFMFFIFFFFRFYFSSYAAIRFGRLACSRRTVACVWVAFLPTSAITFVSVFVSMRELVCVWVSVC